MAATQVAQIVPAGGLFRRLASPEMLTRGILREVSRDWQQAVDPHLLLHAELLEQVRNILVGCRAEDIDDLTHRCTESVPALCVCGSGCARACVLRCAGR